MDEVSDRPVPRPLSSVRILDSRGGGGEEVQFSNSIPFELFSVCWKFLLFRSIIRFFEVYFFLLEFLSNCEN